MRTACLIALAALTACTSYAHLARTNAPGNVDLSTPPEHENGTDDLVVPEDHADPGQRSIIAFLHPAFGGGMLRHGPGYEFSFGISIEKDQDRQDWFAKNAWGASIGMGIAQVVKKPGMAENVTESPGPFWIEAYRRKTLVMYSAGALVYPDTRDIGAQVTIHAPLTNIRARWAQSSGFEVMLAWDLNFPLVFAWSQ